MREQAAAEVRRGLAAVAKAPHGSPGGGLAMMGALRNCVNRELLASAAAASTGSLSNGAQGGSQQHPLMMLNNGLYSCCP